MPAEGDNIKVGASKESANMNTTQQILSLLENYAESGTTGDPFAISSCLGLLEHHKSGGKLVNVIANAVDRRQNDKPLTLSHAVHLATIHGPNYIQWAVKQIENYPYQEDLNLNQPGGWRDLYDEIEKERLSSYEEILNNNEIKTTMPNRAIDYSLISDILFGDEEISVLDLGCSANWTWTHLEMMNGDDPDKFYANDQTPGEIVMQYANKGVRLKKQVGIDHSDPLKDKDSTDWFLSCRHIRDMNSKSLQKTRERMERYKNHRNTSFREGDISQLPENEDWDVITASLVLYQQPPELQQEIIRKAINVLNPKGALVIKDYCMIDPKDQSKLLFTDERGTNSFRTLVYSKRHNKWFEFLEFATSVCDAISPGKDFEQFMQLKTERTM